jgi:hypothetical protein
MMTEIPGIFGDRKEELVANFAGPPKRVSCTCYPKSIHGFR